MENFRFNGREFEIYDSDSDSTFYSSYGSQNRYGYGPPLPVPYAGSDYSNNSVSTINSLNYSQRRRNATRNIENAFLRYRSRLIPNRLKYNNKILNFDIFKYQGNNKACRNKYVIYYNKKNNSIGIKYVEDNPTGYKKGFKPNFLKRNIFYLEVLPSNFYNKFVYIQHNNITLKKLRYSYNDFINKEDVEIKLSE